MCLKIPLSLEDELEIYDILKDIHNTTDSNIKQDEIIQEIRILCKDILEKGGDILI
jgi:hypothetical protein